VFDQAFDSMYLLDEEFKVVEANAAFAALLGRPLKDVYGLHPWDWNPDLPTSGSLVHHAAYMPTEPITFETRLQSLDGSVHDVAISTTPTKWGGRKLIFCVMRDITAHKQAEKALRDAEQQLRQVMDSLDEGLFIINMEGELLSWNPAGRHILGIPDQGFEHVRLAEYPEFLTVFAADGSVLPPEQWPLVRALHGERMEHQEFRTRSKFLKEDRMISYSCSIAEIGNGKQFAYLRCQDVTARWWAESGLRGTKT
jgi:PAS domain S-box-containing protein